MSVPSFTKQVMARPWLRKFMTPIAEWYKDKAGYRQLGLK